MEIQTWIIPITILPAVFLFILSTSNISSTLGTEINQLLEKAGTSKTLIKRKIDQLKRLHIALTTKYISAICFALSGFIGSIGIFEETIMNKIYLILMIVGIALIIIAIIHMIIFAYKAIYNRQLQFKDKIETQTCAKCGEKYY